MKAEGLAALAVLLLVSVAARETPLFFLALSLLAAVGSSRLWQRYGLSRIEYRRRFSRTTVSFGENVELEIEVVNRKILPLVWIEIEDEIPHALPPSKGRLRRSPRPLRSLLAALVSLLPYERLRRRYTIPCVARGEHRFGPVRLQSGDLFGYAFTERTLDTVDTLVVYPRVVPVARLGLPPRHPLGEIRARSWLFEDVTRIAGAREHRPEDGLRRIHWPASARTQRLQSRVYEATTSHQLALFLNLAADGGPWPGCEPDQDVVEMTVMAAASLANWGLEQGYPTGVYTNGMHPGRPGSVTVEPARGSAQRERMLLALARLGTGIALRFDDLMNREARRLPYGSTLVVVTPALAPATAAAISALRGRGHPVAVILTGRQHPSPPMGGVAFLRVGPPEAWRQMPSLELLGVQAPSVESPPGGITAAI